MSFEKKMEEMDALLAAAKTADEKAAVLEKIVDELDSEMKAQGVSDEDREDKIAEVIAGIMNLMGDVEDAEKSNAAAGSTGELDN